MGKKWFKWLLSTISSAIFGYEIKEQMDDSDTHDAQNEIIKFYRDTNNHLITKLNSEAQRVNDNDNIIVLILCSVLGLILAIAMCRFVRKINRCMKRLNDIV